MPFLPDASLWSSSPLSAIHCLHSSWVCVSQSFCFTFSVSLDFSVSLSSLSISVELTSSHLHREAVVHTALLPFVEDHLCAGPWAAILKLDPFLLGREVSQCSRVADTVWN